MGSLRVYLYIEKPAILDVSPWDEVDLLFQGRVPYSHRLMISNSGT